MPAVDEKFMACMENVLDIYALPLDQSVPVL